MGSSAGTFDQNRYHLWDLFYVPALIFTEGQEDKMCRQK